MKTSVNMIRKMGNFEIVQRTKDSYFCATDLVKQWNDYSGQNKELKGFTRTDNAKEFINALEIRLKEKGEQMPPFISGKGIGLIESGTGMIVGECELIGCSAIPVPKCREYINLHKIENLELLDRWKWAWFIDEAKRYDKPIPYKHPQGAVIWVNLTNGDGGKFRLRAISDK